MSKVKLTFEKTERGERIIVTKEGGFTGEDMSKVTEAVEGLFHNEGAEVEDSPEESEDEETQEAGGASSGGDGAEEPFMNRVRNAAQGAKGQQGSTTPPEGRGQVQAKLPDGTGIKSDGSVDRRTLRGSPENPDPKQQKLAKKVSKGAAEART